MSTAEIQQLEERGLAAWNEHKPGDFADLFADDFTFSDLTLPDAVRSKDQVRQFMESWLTAFPDLRLRRTNQVVSEGAAAGEIEFTGTNTGPLVIGGTEIPATGKSVNGAGAYFVSVRDGKIVSFSNHPDVAGLMAQLGMLPGA